jgi:hypothetical protein
MRTRYEGRPKTGKSALIDEVCAVLEISRKHAIKLLNRDPNDHRPKPGRPRIYRDTEQVVLRKIWAASEYPCGKRLKAVLPLWLPHYEMEEGRLSSTHRKKLLEMSAATMDRLLEGDRADLWRGKCGTKPGSLIRSQIPIQSGPWDVDRAGYFEADTVAHCGGSMAGDFIWSITFTDVLVGWTEIRATWNKGAAGVLEQVKDLENTLPYAILGFDTDNGSEFLNHHLVRYFRQRDKPVKFTRSRPYKKNDNAHVEQKNWTHVRQLLGYNRLENPALVEPLNVLYREKWGLLQNFFLPNMKLVSKQRVGGRTTRKYDVPQTPYTRLKQKRRGVRSKKLGELRDLHASLNPFELKREIELGLKGLL